jgi:hypothetical protein
MATYSSFKKIDTDAIINSTIISEDLANSSVPTAAIANNNVTDSKIIGVVTSEKLSSSIDLSGKSVTYRPIVNNDMSSAAAIAGTKLASNAATTNLGFAPVNAAGDTMSGTLRLPAGTAAAPSIRHSGSSNTGIYFPTTDQVSFSVGGNERLRIQNPNTLIGNRPSFNAVGTTGWFYANTFGGGEREIGSTWGWVTNSETGGTNFAPGTGRFTAPVSGYYHFNTMYYLLNDANSAPHYVHLFFRKNNTRAWMPGGRSPYTINMHSMASSYDDGASYSAIMQLNAGDFCSLGVVWHGFSSRMHAGHQFFNGHLIG